MILVTGATGRVGQHVVRVLTGAGFRVRSLIRKGSEYYWLNDTGTAYFFGDLRDRESLRNACRGVSWLVSCAGVRAEKLGQEHRSVTVDGHRHLWRAARREGVRRVVHVSCLAVEHAPPRGGMAARKRAEGLLRDSGLEHVILRPAPYVEDFAELALRARRRGWVVLPPHGEIRVSPIRARDVALHAVAALDLEGIRDRTIPLGGPQTVTLCEAVEQALRAAGAEGARRIVPPVAAVRAGAILSAKLSRRHARRLDDWLAACTHPQVAEPGQGQARFQLPTTAFDTAIEPVLHEIRGRVERTAVPSVSHRRCSATIYEPGTVPLADLPPGPGER